MPTLRDLLNFTRKPKSFDERMFFMTVHTPFTLEDITNLMNISGMNIDEIEIIVKKQNDLGVSNLKLVTEAIQKGLYNWKELI